MRAYSQALCGLATILLPAFAHAAWPSPKLGDVAEPMVFDMVRGLDAKMGEVEANVLAQVPIGSEQVIWAPEVEFAYMDGAALELELGFDDTDLTAIKLGIQHTWAQTKTSAQGTQWLGEYNPQTEDFETALLYVGTANLDPKWSIVGIMGPELAIPAADDVTVGAAVNVTVFFLVRPWLTLGQELNFEFINGETLFRAMPQIHLGFTPNIEWQVGLGLLVDHDELWPEFATRLVFEL